MEISETFTDVPYSVSVTSSSLESYAGTPDSSGSETAAQGHIDTVSDPTPSTTAFGSGSLQTPVIVEPNRYQKYQKIIKDILFIPVSIFGFCIVIASVGIMAILGGFVLAFYIVKEFCECVANDGARIYKYIFETETEIVALVNIAAVVVDAHIIDVRVVDIISENNMNHEQIAENSVDAAQHSRSVLPVAIAVNKRQIIPL